MARQTIKPGATIDAATPDEVARIIATAFDKKIDTHYRREKAVATLDGTGAGVIILKTTRLYDWECQRVTLVAGAGGQVQFYENQQQASDLLENVILDANGRYSDAFSNNLFVPAGSQLYVVFVGAGANGQAAVNLQIRLIKAVGGDA